MQKLRKNKFFLIIGSLIGMIFIIVGISTILTSLDKMREVIAGSFYLLAGLIIFPPFDYLLEKCCNIKLPSWLNGVLFLAFVIVAEKYSKQPKSI